MKLPISRYFINHPSSNHAEVRSNFGLKIIGHFKNENHLYARGSFLGGLGVQFHTSYYCAQGYHQHMRGQLTQ